MSFLHPVQPPPPAKDHLFYSSLFNREIELMKKIIKTNPHGAISSSSLEPDPLYINQQMACGALKPDHDLYLGQRAYSPHIDGFRGFCPPDHPSYLGAKMNPPCRLEDDCGQAKSVNLLMDSEPHIKRTAIPGLLKGRPQAPYYDTGPPHECQPPYGGPNYPMCSPLLHGDGGYDSKSFYSAKRGSSASSYCSTPAEEDLSPAGSEPDDPNSMKCRKNESDKSETVTTCHSGPYHQKSTSNLDNVA